MTKRTLAEFFKAARLVAEVGEGAKFKSKSEAATVRDAAGTLKDALLELFAPYVDLDGDIESLTAPQRRGLEKLTVRALAASRLLEERLVESEYKSASDDQLASETLKGLRRARLKLEQEVSDDERDETA